MYVYLSLKKLGAEVYRRKFI